MKRNILSYVFVALATISALSSCIKDDAPGVGSAGSPRVKILEATRRPLFYSPFTEVKTITLFSIRRDETTPAGIDKAISVKVLAVPDSVQAYNDANGTDYEPLPDSLYQLVDNGVTRDGDNFSIPLASKAIGNELTINLDGAKWDVTHKYGMWYKIEDPAGLTVTTDAGYVFVTIEAKNKWDGIYKVEGSMTDVANPVLGNVNLYLDFDQTYADPPMQLELRTLSPTTCVCYDNYFYGGYFKAISSNNGDGTFTYSSYGSFCAIFEFDPATDKIVAVTNWYGQPAGNSRYAEIDPSGDNQYDASSKIIKIKYWMNQPSVVTDPPYHRSAFNEVWTYLGPRN